MDNTHADCSPLEAGGPIPSEVLMICDSTHIDRATDDAEMFRDMDAGNRLTSNSVVSVLEYT